MKLMVFSDAEEQMTSDIYQDLRLRPVALVSLLLAGVRMHSSGWTKG
jgi:hypothetical protein